MSSQSGQKVLRIGLIHNGKIIEERLIRTMEPVKIGSEIVGNQLFVPGSNVPKSVVLFSVEKERYVLNLLPGMDARLSLGDGVKEIDELVRLGQAKKTAQGYSIPLTAGSRGKVMIEDSSLLFQFVKPPVARPAPVLSASMRGGFNSNIDRRYIFILLLSAFVQFGFVIWLTSQEWPIPEDLEYEFPSRFVHIRADKEPEEPPPVEPEVVEGEGEGESTGEPVAAAPTPERESGGDSSSPEQVADQRARERTMRQVEDKTLLRVLGAKGEGGGTVVDTLLGGVGNISAEEAFANSTGVQHAEAGVERSGIRKGGSPDADGVGARAGIDDIGGLKGTKQAKAGVDTGKVAESQIKARPIKIQDPSDMAGGTLDNKSVATAIRRRQAAIQACYERELRRNHQAGGRIVVNFTITARGSRGVVSQAKAVVDDVGGGVGQCVAKEIESLRGLPAPEGGDVIINMPFVFQPGQ